MCLEKCRNSTKKYKAKLKEQSLCQCCGKEKIYNDKYYCHKCLKADAGKRDERKKNGMCIYCSDPIHDNLVTCKRCNLRNKIVESEIRHRRKSEGLCIKCGTHKTENGHVKCEKCLSAQAKWWHAKNKKNLERNCCIDCGDRPLNNHRFCEKCYLKKVATKRLGDSKRWSELKVLYESQGAICPYSGDCLFLGVNADLDHVVPVAKGGSNCVSNLQWVMSMINTMKWTNSEQEFLRLIKNIYEYRKLDEMS